MPVVATASVSYSRRILLMVLLCAVFSGMFFYDGFYNWPRKNDDLINNPTTGVISHPMGDQAKPENMAIFKAWPGYQHASAADIDMMDAVTKATLVEEWKTSYDIFYQRLLAIVIGVLALVILYWYSRYRAKRAIADEAGLSPAPGVQVPWASITQVDNTRWKKSGIVMVTWKDAQGEQQTAKLDEYDLDNLVPVLVELEKHATNAEFIPKPELPPDPPPAETPPVPTDPL